jgi:C4-dicarboxylate-binding protein DctP
MTSKRSGWMALATGACMAALSVMLTLGPARAQDKTYTMKISLATINDQIHAFVRNFAAALEKDSGGRIKTEIYPASQLGSIPRQTEGVQFGAIQCQVVPPEFLVGLDERFEVMAAPGLIDSMARGQKLVADPDVLKLMLGLGADKGLHGVGLFMVNPSAILQGSDPPYGRFQRQEDPHLCLAVPECVIRPARCHASGHEPR